MFRDTLHLPPLKGNHVSQAHSPRMPHSPHSGGSHGYAMISQSGALAIVALFADSQELRVGLDGLDKTRWKSLHSLKSHHLDMEKNKEGFGILFLKYRTLEHLNTSRSLSTNMGQTLARLLILAKVVPQDAQGEMRTALLPKL